MSIVFQIRDWIYWPWSNAVNMMHTKLVWHALQPVLKESSFMLEGLDWNKYDVLTWLLPNPPLCHHCGQRCYAKLGMRLCQWQCSQTRRPHRAAAAGSSDVDERMDGWTAYVLTEPRGLGVTVPDMMCFLISSKQQSAADTRMFYLSLGNTSADTFWWRMFRSRRELTWMCLHGNLKFKSLWLFLCLQQTNNRSSNQH